MIKLRNLYLDSLKFQSRNGHYSLVRRLGEDNDVYNYISKRFTSFVQEPEKEDDYDIGKSYVIYNQEHNLIGMCGSTKLDKNGIIDLWIAIDKTQRRKGYGEKITVQLTEYFLESIKDLKDIKLVINKNNHGSNKTAINSGYTLSETFDDKNIYRYFGK